MRDIRSDLRERLDRLQIEGRKLEKRREDLARRGEILSALLRDEEERFAKRQASLSGSSDRRPEPTTPIGRFIRETMVNGQPWPLARLKEAAKTDGIDFEGKDPGRVLHFALVGMKHNGYVEIVESGVWRLAKQE